MMLRERSFDGRTVHVPPWSSASDDTASSYDDYSLFLKTLQRYLPSNCNDVVAESKFADVDNVEFLPVDAQSCDHFRMFEFKVRKCTRGRSHDWTECPFAHSGEKARRRDPRKYHYSATSCPDFRKGSCRKGDSCEFSHGVFECWLHPARYRTQPCKDGMSCKRRVCFFAHSPDQLRHPSPAAQSFMSSPDPVSPSTESPPISPMMAASFRQLHLNQVKLVGSSQSPPTGFGYFEAWERVESGRDLRVKRIEKLSKETPLDQVLDPNPDVDWVSDLIN